MKITQEGITTRLAWVIEDEEDVKSANEFFLKLTRQGWLAVRREIDGYKRILEFKPQYGELLFLPIVEGGYSR